MRLSLINTVIIPYNLYGDLTELSSWQLSPSLGVHKLAPTEKPNQALAAQACRKLGSGSGQAKVRFPHLQLRLKQHLLRSRDGN
jgi:hypothetical protein